MVEEQFWELADDREAWSPVGLEDDVYSPPRGNGLPPLPVVRAPLLLPTHLLSWEDFEKLVYSVARWLDGAVSVHRYGVRGQAQHGIDVVAFFSDATRTVYQAKSYQRFSESDLEEAVRGYADGERRLGAERLVIVVSCEARTTAMVDRLAALKDIYPDLVVELWDQEGLSEMLRDHPTIVGQFFGLAWRRAFCGEEPPPTAEHEGIRADAIIRGPIRHLGLGEDWSTAESEMDSNPTRAAERFNRIANELEATPFAGHAVRFRIRQAQCLEQAGDYSTSGRVRLKVAWKLAESADLWTARGILKDLDRIQGELSDAILRSAGMLAAFVQWRTDHRGFVDRLAEAFDHMLENDPDRVLAALVFGEECLANRRMDLVRDRAPVLLGIADSLPDHSRSQLIAARLRCSVADSTGRWEGLAMTARRHFDPAVTALVLARSARFLSVHLNPTAAKERYLDAIQYATGERCYGDASAWLYALRNVYQLFDGPFAGLGDFHRSAQALEACGEASVIPSAGARQLALAQFISRSWPDALQAVKRFLWHSTTVASWAEEIEAHRLLGDIYSETGRHTDAARHYVAAGDVKKAAALAKRVPEKTFHFPPPSDATPPWERAAAYSLIGTLGDLVPDEDATEWGKMALKDVTVTPSSDHVHGYVHQAAARALSEFSEAMHEEGAQRFLDYMSEAAEQGIHHHPSRIESHVRTLFGVARHHASLRAPAVALAMDLLLSSDFAHVIDWADGQDVLHRERHLVEEKIGDAALAGNTTACLVLVTADSRQDLVAGHARERLNAAVAVRVSEPGRQRIGTTYLRDAVLMYGLNRTDKEMFVDAMMRIAIDQREPALNRQDALLAAARLVGDLSDTRRQEVFELALACARGEHDPRSETDLFSAPPDPLSRFQINLGPQSLRAPGLRCAAHSASTQRQTTMVYDLAIQVLNSDIDIVSYHAANAITALPAEVVAGDLTMLSTHPSRWARSVAASAWAVTSNADPQIGTKLASDNSARVRRILSSSLQDTPEHLPVRQQLATDPRRSVRTLIHG